MSGPGRADRRMGRRFTANLGLDLLARCRVSLFTNTPPEIGADTLPALTA